MHEQPTHMPFVPDAEQCSVLELAPETSAVVIGAAGTGKTAVLIERAVQLLRAGAVQPDQLMVLTPSRQTATRLRDRVGLALGIATPGAVVRSLGSFAFQVLRSRAVGAGEPAPQLLTGADQDRIIADLLDGDAQDEADGEPRWPEDLPAPVRASRTFRSELRNLMAECTELGVTWSELDALAQQQNMPVWTAVASFLREYRQVLTRVRPTHRDAADLLADAARILREAAPGAAGAATLGPLSNITTIFIDDAQELTRGGIALVSALRARGVHVVAFGDPDLGSGSFRGVTPELFAELAHQLGALIVLEHSHRATPELVRMTRTLTQGIGVGGRVEHRRPPEPTEPDQRVAALLASSPYAETDAIAATLRRWYLHEGVRWDQMAVIAHDTRQVARLEVELGAREVPTLAAGVQRPLGSEPVVRQLLDIIALTSLAQSERSAEAVQQALLSPFGGLDAIGMRRLRAALRHSELAEGGSRTALELLHAACMQPLELLEIDTPEARIAERFAATLSRLTEAHERGETIHELLWLVWDRARFGSERLADVWREQALGVSAASAEAGRSLDALTALFEAAKRAVERGVDADPLSFIRNILDTDVPEDSLTAADRAHTVTLMTPAQALGTEFDAVVIAGVQDGVWPNTRLRGGLLQGWMLAEAVLESRAGRSFTAASSADRRKAVLQDEVRLFVRALSRAHTKLLVTATEDDDNAPSMLLELFGDPLRTDEGDYAHPVTLRGLVARHRRTLTAIGAEQASAQDRANAASQLRLLADEGIPGAAVEEWYGMMPASTEEPLRDPRLAPIPVSPSTIEGFEACGIDWAVRALGGNTSTWSGGLGTILHAAMETLPNGSVEQLQELVDSRWGELQFEAEWISQKERAWAHTLVERLHSYLKRFSQANAEVLGAEAEFSLAIPLRDEVSATDVSLYDAEAPAEDLEERGARVVLRGSIDRVERFPAGAGEDLPAQAPGDERARIVVADLKTTRSPKKYLDSHVTDDAQLSAYQLAVAAGAVPGADPSELVGARLVLLSQLKVGQQYRLATQPAFDQEAATAFVQRVVEDARGMAQSHFHGDVDAHCQVDRYAVCTIHTVKAVSAS